MANHVSIQINHTEVGSVVFDEAPAGFDAYRTIPGFVLKIPATVTLDQSEAEAPRPMLTNLRGQIYAAGASGSPVEIGSLGYDQPITASVPRHTQQVGMIWSDVCSALVGYEKIRNGNPPRFQIRLSFDVSNLVRVDGSGRWFCTEPQRLSGRAEITYAKDVWVKMIRDLGLAENVLVEIPLPRSPAAPWDKVWQALVEARDAFEQGGATGWKGCVSAVRLALEEWAKPTVEPPNQGPGWKAPSKQERESRTRQQRLDALRWHLMQCAHMAPHSSAEDWSREDALLMLATLSALLEQRKP